MAEVLGTIASGLTLAALFKTCVEAFELIQAGRKQEQDFKKLELRLNIEKCRLYTWGQAMGLTDGDCNQGRPIDSFQFSGLVQESLEVILDLFNDANKIRDRYGCEERPSQLGIEDEGSDVTRHLTASFAGFRISGQKGKSSRGPLQKVKWVIQDRKKFAGFISEVKEWIDRLKDITCSISSKAGQEQMIRQRIAKITNIETLEMISEVCEADHPVLSDAASVRAETLSMPTSKRVDIERWSGDICEVTELTVVEDVESLSVTELKHQNLRLREDLRTLHARVEQLLKGGGNGLQDSVHSRKRAWSPAPSESPITSKRVALSHPALNPSMSLSMPSVSALLEVTGIENINSSSATGLNQPTRAVQRNPAAEYTALLSLGASRSAKPYTPISLHPKLSPDRSSLPRPFWFRMNDVLPQGHFLINLFPPAEGWPAVSRRLKPPSAPNLPITSTRLELCKKKRLISNSGDTKLYFGCEPSVKPFSDGLISGVLDKAYMWMAVGHNGFVQLGFWFYPCSLGVLSNHPYLDELDLTCLMHRMSIDSRSPFPPTLVQALAIPRSPEILHSTFFFRLEPCFPNLPGHQKLVDFMDETLCASMLTQSVGNGSVRVILIPGRLVSSIPEIEKSMNIDSKSLVMMVIARGPADASNHLDNYHAYY